MKKRLFSVMLMSILILSTFLYAGGNVGQVVAADTTLAEEAGISAYADVGPLTLYDFYTVFDTIEYQALDGSFLIGLYDMPGYADEYNPLVLVQTDGQILAYYPKTNSAGEMAPAAKMVDVIGKTLDETLLEKAVKSVASAAGLSVDSVSYYDFALPDVTTLLLVSEYQADGNTFTLNLPSANTYSEKSYGFYRSYEASFTLDNDLIEQVCFVTVNADYPGEGVYGSIYGHFGEDTEIDFGVDQPYTFAVWNPDFYAYGALAIAYSGAADAMINDADEQTSLALSAPVGAGDLAFDFTPGDFEKDTADPILDVEKPLDATLSWSASTAPNYEYCIDTIELTEIDPYTGETDEICDTAWVGVPVGESAVTLSHLYYDTTYYWQVRATNSYGAVYADGGDWGSFTTTNGVAPDAFAKSFALVDKPGVPSQLVMTWDESYGAYYYEYCIDTVAGCTAPETWHNVGLATTVTVSSLEFDTTYFWQVRAWNGYDLLGPDADYYTYADGPDDGAWIEFDTRTFGKLSPTDGALISTATSAPLVWEMTGPALSYEYCLSTLEDHSDCTWKAIDDTGQSEDSEMRVTVTGLTADTTYFWQVRAKTAGADIEANDGDWWAFTTAAKKGQTPALFKASPVDGAIVADLDPTLEWKQYKKSFVEYQYCFFAVDDTDTTPISADDECTLYEENWVSAGKDLSATIGVLDSLTTYYWQVRLVLAGDIYVYADKGEYWSFTTP